MRNTESLIGNRRVFVLAGLMLFGIAALAGLWVRLDRKEPESVKDGVFAEARGNVPEARKQQDGEKLGKSGSGVDEAKASNSHPSPQISAGASKQQLQALAVGDQKIDERVRQLQGMRGSSLSKEERESALAFLGGKEVPDGLPKASMQWLADELLTVMRLQEPPWDDLSVELGKVAFQPTTDPVVRDYIMQHLGHLWEQSGPRKEIGDTLWRAVASTDETTPGTALIALSRGYERDGQEKGLAKVRQQSIALAQDSNTPLSVRVTALSIAGDGGGTDMKQMAEDLVGNPETPVILRKVAEQIVK